MNNKTGIQFSPPLPEIKLLHELQTHQLELEMQNEQLRQSQIELEKSRDRYVDFYDFAPVGYLTLSRNGVIDEINLTGAALLGLTRDKLLSHRFAPFIAPRDRERWDRFFLEVLKNDNKLSCELMFLHGDKSCLYAQLDCRQLNKDGRETVVRVSLTDITERKQLVKSRQEALERFQSMARLAPGIVYQFKLLPNGSTCMPYVSDAFQKIFGLNPAQVKNDASKVFDLIHPDDLENTVASIQASARNLTPWQHDFRLKHEDGSLCWLFGNSQPQREADGSTLWHGFLTDITERKLVEKSLLASEHKFHVLTEVMPQIVWVTRPDGWNIYFNQQWVDYTGLTLEESCGDGWIIPFHPDDQQRAMDTWQHAVQTIGIYSLECRLRRSDGLYRWWLIRGIPQHDENNEVISWVGTCTDIEEQKQTEAALMQITQDLNERVKELRCLYDLSRLTAEDGLPLHAIFEEAVHNIPLSFKHPEICCCRIVYLDQEFATANFKKMPFNLSADIVVTGMSSGTLEVCYLEERCERDEGPFLKEERLLIDALAINFGMMLVFNCNNNRI